MSDTLSGYGLMFLGWFLHWGGLHEAALVSFAGAAVFLISALRKAL